MRPFFGVNKLLSSMILLASAFEFNVACVMQTTKVPDEFRYPESQETVRYDSKFQSKNLSGQVVDTTGGNLSKVLVERMSSRWKMRIEAIFTNSKGFFKFASSRKKEHFLRFSKPGFKTVLLKILVKNGIKKNLQLELLPSQ